MVRRALAGLAILIVSACATGTTQSTTVTLNCVDPPVGERVAESAVNLAVEPNPVAAGSEAVLSIGLGNLPRTTITGIAADWQCWDGGAWVQTHYLLKAFDGRQPNTVDLASATTLNTEDLGLRVPGSYPILIPEVPPGTYRIADTVVPPDETLHGHVIVTVVETQEMTDCGEERLVSLSGPFNTEARECFADAIENGTEAELRLYGFDEEGGEMARTLRQYSDHAVDIITSDIGTVIDRCGRFSVVEGLAGNPGFNALGCVSATTESTSLDAVAQGDLTARAIAIACGGICTANPLYVRDQLLDIDTLVGNEQPMPPEIADAIRAVYPNVAFFDMDRADALGPDVDAGRAVLINVAPVTELAPDVVGIDVGVSFMSFYGQTIQFMWDGSNWVVADSDDTGVTVTSVVS